MQFFVAAAFLFGSLALAQGDYVLKVICDDISTIFVDGVQKDVAGTGAWNQLATLSIPETTIAIGIQCQNTGGPYGIMAQVEDSDGNVFVVSDDSWQCNNAAQDGWATGDFTGDWSAAAYTTGQVPYLGDTGAWQGMSPNKKVIWTASAADSTAFCRRNLGKPTDMRFDVVGDDVTTIYVDGEEKQVPGTQVWNQMASLMIPGETGVVGIKCYNSGGPYGIMAQIKDSSNKVVAVSDDSWHCSNTEEDGWSTLDFEEGDSWKPAAYYSGQPPYKQDIGAWKGMSPNKRIIWTETGDATVYCRKVLNAKCKRRSLGCWKDTGNRAISGGIRFNSQNIDDCEKYAADRGYTTFAVQYNSECFTSADADKTYSKYGESTGCNAEGRGGGWAQNVYQISCGPLVHTVAISGDWKPIPGGLVKITKGQQGVWGVNRHDNIYTLNSDGTSWTNVGGKLVQIASGASVWGVNRADMIYKRTGNTWTNIAGRLTNVAVSDNDNVWGVNRGGNIYRWLGSTWEQIDGAAIEVSAGNCGVWVVNSNNDIFYRVGTYGDVQTKGSGWVHVPGKLKWISSGTDVVVGVNSDDDIYEREGITSDNPTGTGWHKVPGKLMNIDIEDGEVVGTNSANNIFRCGMVGPPPPVPYSPCESGSNACIREKGTGLLMPAGSNLVSNNGRAILKMQEDGNLVLYCVVKGKVLWASNTNGKNVDSGLKIQDDGNLVLYAGDTAVWASNTDGHPDSVEFVVQDDHNVVLYDYESREVFWASDTNFGADRNMDFYCPDAKFVEGCAGNKCVREEQVAGVLSLGNKIVSDNGKAALTMQTDGNLVLTCQTTEEVLWSSKTSGVDLGLRIQSDGNLVMYDANRKVLWASDTNGNFDKVELVVQDDMNVVLYKSEGREVLWATNTHTAVCPDARSDVGTWVSHENKYLSGYSAGEAKYDTEIKAKKECNKRTDCGGITYEPLTGKFTLRRDTELKDSPSQETSWLPISSDDEGGHVFVAEVNTNYELHKVLEVGDTITAFGIYKDATTSKFNLNIMGQNNLNLLHVDFRPWGDVLVLNSFLGRWQTEIRPAFPKSKLEGGKVFSVSVVVMEAEYKVLYNGQEVGKFPQRQVIGLASHIRLRGGSNGFMWVAADLPPGTTGPGLAKPCGTSETQTFMRPLAAEDVITVWGIFAEESDAFSINLMTDKDNRILHISFRPPPGDNQIVLNSMLNGAWQAEDRTPFPLFVHGQPFKVQILCQEDKFRIFVDGNEIGKTFPYRDGFSLADTKLLLNVGGSNGMVFTDMSPPDDNEAGHELMSTSLTSTSSSVGWEGVPGRAIDGNTNGNYYTGSCSCSAGTRDNWWRVTLAKTSAIKFVTIYNRKDAAPNRIDGARVYAGVRYCGDVKYEVGKSVYSVECDGAVAEFVQIEQDNDYLTLCEVQVYGKPSDDLAWQNIAIGKPTWESSVGWGGTPQRAIDGRCNGIWGAHSCTHSANTQYNMWKVDLLDNYYINQVVIYNRKDCCADRIDGVKVFVNREECGSVTYKEGVSVYSVDCGGVQGSVVKITQENNYLTLCEVQVLGTRGEEFRNLINVARDGTAVHSTTANDAPAERAIDGNINGDFEAGSCSQIRDPGGNWKLNFDDQVAVKYLVIYNVQGENGERIDGATVKADDMVCGRIKYVEGQEAYKVGCRSDTTEHTIASSITIEAGDGQLLTLCEVKVMSDPRVEIDEVEHLVNLAYGKPASQSSTGWNGVAERGNDGKEMGKYFSNTCTHTNGPGWWMVNLQDTYSIKKVWIKNRVDCCSDRINEVEVSAGDIPCGKVEYVAGKYSYTVECGDDGIVASSLKIENKKTHLTLCEVKVWGPSEPVLELEEEDEEVTGGLTPAVDDATSVAKCKSGKVVTYCEVKTGRVADGADGAEINEDGGNMCTAYNGWQGTGAIARAICSEQLQITDPCNGPKLPLYKNFWKKGESVTLNCPAGYDAIHCNAHSPWYSLLKGQVSEDGIIPNDQECTVKNCISNVAGKKKYCDISLVCKMKTEEEYREAVCPTCDGYTCGDGYECEMVDDDGEDAKQYPTCVLKPTGCLEDRCGDFGECEPKGADDYICICQDGNYFDEEIGTCLPVRSIFQIVYGEEAFGDDARSYASCEAGQRVVRCHTHGAPSSADGVKIDCEDDICTCVARASHADKYPVRAVAYCGDDFVTTDPCTQDDIHHFNYRFSDNLSPSVHCDGGYIMESCIFHSKWTQFLSEASMAKINSIGSVQISDDGSCSLPDSLSGCDASEHPFTTLTAVCKKLTGDEYLKQACPTCDDVRCPEGNECKMSDAGLPQCVVRIPGGCEENKCGEHGECKEDGADYECLCKSGYRFDSVTCIDVDECAEEPCGNGECTNTDGSYTCDCNEGYKLLQGTCEDIDECADDSLNPCSETERCSNVEGSAVCDCPDTFIRKKKKSKECVCANGFENKDGVCVHIDQCAKEDACGENEICTNTKSNYKCTCKEGFKKGEDGTCQEFTPLECDVRPQKPVIKAIKGNNVKVKLKGETKKVFKKYADIKWTKNGDPWNPKSDGKSKFDGFIIRKFDAQDAGMYVGEIFIKKDGESYKCDVEVEIVLLEGSVKLSIANAKSLQRKQKAGKPLAIKCDADIDNLKLKDPKSPDNINWYRVFDDGDDELLESNDNISIEKGGGSYQLKFNNPTAADSGTYRCEFDQQGVDAFTDITIEIKG